jgi:ribosome-dependent ATPase
LPDSLPLGIRQRLSLAVAVIHEPEILILDEPTSGVDPVARDSFWELLIALSRQQGVTIFISTHFMNEGARCDRISLMHAGKVLAQDAPAALLRARGVQTLEDAFIASLEEATAAEQETGNSASAAAVEPAPTPPAAPPPEPWRRFSFRRLWAYAHREALELRRDPIRLAFALLGPLLLMITCGYGISFDVEHLSYAVLDRDHSPESRAYLEQFAGSRYFHEQPSMTHYAEMEQRLRSGTLQIAIEIPPDFGRDLKRGRQPEVGVWLDGAMPFRAETSRGYVEGVHQAYLAELARRESGQEPPGLPADIAVRFRYNQEFKSVFAIVPGVIMLMLGLIPTMMTAVGVVREKEMGSITNLYVTPVTGLEFLLGKQVPYAALAFASFMSLLLLGLGLFQVPVKGSLAALLVGAALYVVATTGFGLLLSTFVKTQVAAIFAAGILSTLPAMQFSGFLKPVSSLSGSARVMGQVFPSTYFQQISLGAFTKALSFVDVTISLVALGALIVGYLLVTLARLKTQEG